MQTPKFPSSEAVDEARQALRALEPLLPKNARRVCLEVSTESKKVRATMPPAAFELLLEILGQMANGNAVTLVPLNAELTTQQAADLLNVSRPFLVELLEQGKIAHRKVGSHRRVKAQEVLRYKQIEEARTRAAVDELTAEAEKLGLGY
ncbi:MAG: helix-turn-helix domain-containing protein [Sandaracinaceae bacterium]|nr:helix-turn-helix domain-containing protein [Sandaracinaceae bacterium]